MANKHTGSDTNHNDDYVHYATMYIEVLHTIFRCFLSPVGGFKWSFLAPVILIFIINFGFFIMAARISWLQHTKRAKSSLVMSWLKSTIPLVVVLGLTWITGVVIVKVKALYPLAYIYTIMVAFQGLFIFLVLVVVPKNMREKYLKFFNPNLTKIVSCSFHKAAFPVISLNEQ